MIKFPINKKEFEFELGFGSYNVMLTGGWNVENIDELDVHLFDTSTSETITLKSNEFFGLRKQDYVGREKVVVAFSFDIQKYSNLKLTINNPEVLIVKRNHSFMFLHNLLFGRGVVSTEDINVVIK